MRQLAGLVFVVAFLGGCAGLTDEAPFTLQPVVVEGDVTPNVQATPPESTSLWNALVPGSPASGTASAFVFLETGEDAYRARLALIEAAIVSIDIQSYIWEFDAGGQAITDALVRAADRGVQIRALIDGFRVDENTEPLKAIARHANIHVRLHNAFRRSFQSDFNRYTELVYDFGRLNQRMHDKVLAVDGAAAILGGRNVSDEYFGLSAERYFYDRDVLVAGPLTADIAASFNRFWGGRYAVPVSHFGAGGDMPVADAIPSPAFSNLPTQFEGAALAQELEGIKDALIWAEARLVRNAPGPVFAEQAPPADAEIESHFLSHVAQATSEITIQMPYVTLTPARREALHDARQRGVRVSLQTNSLASIDWGVVQHGYVQERRKLLHWGIELFELKDEPTTCCDPRGWGVAPETVVLHPKTIVFDRRFVLIGSFNLDRRSIHYNSEIGLIIDSPDLAAGVLARTRLAMAPENSWRLVLGDDGKPVWLDETRAPPIRHLDDPNTGLLDQFLLWLGYLIPIDSLL